MYTHYNALLRSFLSLVSQNAIGLNLIYELPLIQHTRFKLINKTEKFVALIFGNVKYIFYHGATAPSGPGPPHSRGFTITHRHATLGRTPLEEESARRRDLYLTTHNIHKRQHPCHRRNSNPQSQQASGRRPTP